MSIAGGLPNAVRRGVAAGCGVVQLFLNRLGLAAFRFLLAHPRLGTVPMVLETPKRDDGDPRNLATLRGLRRGSRHPR